MMGMTLQLRFYTRSVVHLVRVTSSAVETPSLCHSSLAVAEQRMASISHIRRLFPYKVSSELHFVRVLPWSHLSSSLKNRKSSEVLVRHEKCVYDGHAAVAPILHMFCDIFSCGNTAFVSIVTDHIVRRKDFMIEYFTVISFQVRHRFM